LDEHPNIVGNHNEEYDFATAPTIKVPGDWNTQVPQLFNYEGVLWYQRDFDAQPKPGTRTFLHIGAANYRSYVWVNQKRVCDHEGGFTPFDCEVTAVLHGGSNFVVIAVDATRLVDGIRSVGYDWFNYGGLTRDVSLITVPTAFIDDYDVHLAHGARFERGNTELTGYVQCSTLVGSVRTPNGFDGLSIPRIAKYFVSDCLRISKPFAVHLIHHPDPTAFLRNK
jgi:beta-glucuronidase